MNKPAIRNFFRAGYLAAPLVLLLLVWPALSADKKPAAAPAPKAAAPAKPAAKPAGGGAAKSSGPTTASHGATTTGHATTATTHTTTTTTSHPTTTSTHTSTTSTSHTTTPGGKSTTTTHTTNTSTHTTTTPKGSKTVQTSHGSVTKRSDGKLATLHDSKRGMDVHHGLNGNRRVEVERADHSRIVAERGGRGYVQRPYMYHGHEYARRSYYYHGRYYNNYYGRYYYRGVYVNPYYPAYYYGPAFYGWAYNPWVAPISYGWGWGGNPWFGYYGAFFTPYTVYASASLWLTDYIIANSLQAAYQAQVDAQVQAAALNGAAPLSPEVKQLIANEVKGQVALENAESKTAGQGGEPNAASSSIQRDLSDGTLHVFVAGSDLDVVDAGGTECALSQGDALQVAPGNAPDATSISLAVLASKGGKECAKGDTVLVSLTDLQDMQNHMRETIDQGMQELQKKQGKGGLPAAPAADQAAPVETTMAAIAPPPPPEKEVAAQINEQSQEADRAEKEAAGDTAGAAPATDAAAPAAAAPPAEVTTGQTEEQVIAAYGQPVRTANVGTKKIYFYKDVKVTFQNGKVSDVQ